MNRPLEIARRLAHRLTPVLGLLLLTALFVGGTHHHPDGREHVCAVCTAGHSAAVSPDLTAPNAAPATSSRQIIAPAPAPPRQARSETASSRAPPLA